MIVSNRLWFGSILIAVGCAFACSCSSSSGGGATNTGTTSDAGADSSSTADGGGDPGPKDASSSEAASPCGTAEYGLPQAMGTLSFKADGTLINTFSQIMESPDLNGSATLILGVNGTKADKHTGQFIRLRFTGTAAGDYACAPGDQTQMDYTADDALPAPPANAAMGAGNCKFHVTSYGAVGEPIVGTFEGLLLAPTNVKITEGAFSLTRCK
jgi:hypothetical protein